MATLTSFSTSLNVGTTATNIYTAGLSEAAFIGFLVFTNTTAGKIDVTIYRLASSETEAASNYMVKKSIQSGDFWNVTEEVGLITLGSSEKLTATSSVSSGVLCNSGGVVEQV